MPILGRKRRQTQVDDDPESSDSASATRSTQRQRQHSSPPADDGDIFDADEAGGGGSYGGVQSSARKLVRYALACEYSRQPIRRADIGVKVLAPQQNRNFKPVFAEAQEMLRDVFGMEMVELPVREKITLQQKRAAQKTDKPAASSSAWVLQSMLPQKYRRADIIPPPHIPTTEVESAYVALYTFILATIYLNGGSLPESKLDRYLRRTNADQHTPVAKKDDLLKRLIKEQYIVKIRDSLSGEEVIEYMVGPRGKVEVGEGGVAGLVRAVYGGSVDDLEKRLDRSLGLDAARAAAKHSVADATSATQTAPTQRRSRRAPSGIEDEGDSDDDDE